MGIDKFRNKGTQIINTEKITLENKVKSVISDIDFLLENNNDSFSDDKKEILGKLKRKIKTFLKKSFEGTVQNKKKYQKKLNKALGDFKVDYQEEVDNLKNENSQQEDLEPIKKELVGNIDKIEGYLDNIKGLSEKEVIFDDNLDFWFKEVIKFLDKYKKTDKKNRKKVLSSDQIARYAALTVEKDVLKKDFIERRKKVKKEFDFLIRQLDSNSLELLEKSEQGEDVDLAYFNFHVELLEEKINNTPARFVENFKYREKLAEFKDFIDSVKRWEQDDQGKLEGQGDQQDDSIIREFLNSEKYQKLKKQLDKYNKYVKRSSDQIDRGKFKDLSTTLTLIRRDYLKLTDLVKALSDEERQFFIDNLDEVSENNFKNYIQIVEYIEEFQHEEPVKKKKPKKKKQSVKTIEKIIDQQEKNQPDPVVEQGSTTNVDSFDQEEFLNSEKYQRLQDELNKYNKYVEKSKDQISKKEVSNIDATLIFLRKHFLELNDIYEILTVDEKGFFLDNLDNVSQDNMDRYEDIVKRIEDFQNKAARQKRENEKDSLQLGLQDIFSGDKVAEDLDRNLIEKVTQELQEVLSLLQAFEKEKLSKNFQDFVELEMKINKIIGNNDSEYVEKINKIVNESDRDQLLSRFNFLILEFNALISYFQNLNKINLDPVSDPVQNEKEELDKKYEEFKRNLTVIEKSFSTYDEYAQRRIVFSLGTKLDSLENQANFAGLGSFFTDFPFLKNRIDSLENKISPTLIDNQVNEFSLAKQKIRDFQLKVSDIETMNDYLDLQETAEELNSQIFRDKINNFPNVGDRDGLLFDLNGILSDFNAARVFLINENKKGQLNRMFKKMKIAINFYSKKELDSLNLEELKEKISQLETFSHKLTMVGGIWHGLKRTFSKKWKRYKEKDLHEYRRELYKSLSEKVADNIESYLDVQNDLAEKDIEKIKQTRSKVWSKLYDGYKKLGELNLEKLYKKVKGKEVKNRFARFLLKIGSVRTLISSSLLGVGLVAGAGVVTGTSLLLRRVFASLGTGIGSYDFFSNLSDQKSGLTLDKKFLKSLSKDQRKLSREDLLKLKISELSQEDLINAFKYYEAVYPLRGKKPTDSAEYNLLRTEILKFSKDWSELSDEDKDKLRISKLNEQLTKENYEKVKGKLKGLLNFSYVNKFRLRSRKLSGDKLLKYCSGLAGLFVGSGVLGGLLKELGFTSGVDKGAKTLKKMVGLTASDEVAKTGNIIKRWKEGVKILAKKGFEDKLSAPKFNDAVVKAKVADVPAKGSVKFLSIGDQDIKIETKSIVAEYTVQKGDTLWGIAKKGLQEKIKNWDSLSKVQQVYLIDGLKDKLIADPEEYMAVKDIIKRPDGDIWVKSLAKVDISKLVNELDVKTQLTDLTELVEAGKVIEPGLDGNIHHFSHQEIGKVFTEVNKIPESTLTSRVLLADFLKEKQQEIFTNKNLNLQTKKGLFDIWQEKTFEKYRIVNKGLGFSSASLDYNIDYIKSAAVSKEMVTEILKESQGQSLENIGGTVYYGNSQNFVKFGTKEGFVTVKDFNLDLSNRVKPNYKYFKEIFATKEEFEKYFADSSIKPKVKNGFKMIQHFSKLMESMEKNNLDVTQKDYYSAIKDAKKDSVVLGNYMLKN